MTDNTKPTPRLSADQIHLDRIAENQPQNPLWRALQPLQTTLSFMNSGAHPDDETSAMLAALGFRDGLHLSYVCANRGEGGQNVIGTESGGALGALRTGEMERAAAQLDMRVYWLSEEPGDPITDFGFSKSGAETFGHWGENLTLHRLVGVVRRERPDILCPTFLDVPGQHGHHRAMTRAARAVMTLAADPKYAPKTGAPWQIKKLFLPAWGGGGGAYDDALPPPEATHIVRAKGRDPDSGQSWETLGQQSRKYHRTQGMGRCVAPDQERDWPLHLLEEWRAGTGATETGTTETGTTETGATTPDTPVTSGVPTTPDAPAKPAAPASSGRLSEDIGAGIAATPEALADLPGAKTIAAALRRLGAACAKARAAFPNTETVQQALADALTEISDIQERCPAALKDEIPHRLDRLAQRITHAAWVASGARITARLEPAWLTIDTPAEFSTELAGGVNAGALNITPILPAGWRAQDHMLGLLPEAETHTGYRAFYDPFAPPLPVMAVEFSLGDHRLRHFAGFETPPVALPAAALNLKTTDAVVNLASQLRKVSFEIDTRRPASGEITCETPAGWGLKVGANRLTVSLPKKLRPGRYRLPLGVAGAPVCFERRILHDHIAPTAHLEAAALRIEVLEARMPDVRVGYIGGGSDSVDQVLEALDVDVVAIADTDLGRGGPDNAKALSARFDTIIVGTLALGTRPGLAEKMPLLHGFAQRGGTLITLYQRPWDNWQPHASAPYFLEIGQPSLRWRVTDENAPVTVLCPDHPLLNHPNVISGADWLGWHKERGLYFAKDWAPEYLALVEMADAGEEALQGGMLVAEVGAGRHVHCALNLHHQLAQLTPGAIRLMANLLDRRVS